MLQSGVRVPVGQVAAAISGEHPGRSQGGWRGTGEVHAHDTKHVRAGERRGSLKGAGGCALADGNSGGRTGTRAGSVVALDQFYVVVVHDVASELISGGRRKAGDGQIQRHRTE